MEKIRCAAKCPDVEINDGVPWTASEIAEWLCPNYDDLVNCRMVNRLERIERGERYFQVAPGK